MTQTKVTGNPWLPARAEEVPEEPARPATPRRFGPSVPRATTVPAVPSDGLASWDAGASALGPDWWWVGCHGGAGVSTLCEAFEGGRDGGRGWPVPSDGGRSRVILVARTNVPGLRAAQSAARQWASGALPGVALLGLTAVADAPGKLPKPLQDLLKLVSGAFPHVWTVPWIEYLRLGDPLTPEALPRPMARMAADLSQIRTRRMGNRPWPN